MKTETRSATTTTMTTMRPAADGSAGAFCELTGRWVKLERFETNFVDLEGPQGLLGQASGRIKTNVIA